jgi:hypothetical protein
MKKLIAVSALSLAALGCIDEEALHTLYLQPDGALTWVAVETQVRSDLDDPQERRQEEREFLESARAGRHPIAEALGSLGPARLETTILRDRRPFHVVTEAELGPVAGFAREVLWRLGVPGEAELVTTGSRRSLEITVWPDQANEDAVDEDDPLLALLSDWDDYRIVLTDGRFVAAQGFEISDDGTVARVVEAEETEEEPAEGEPLVLSLTWTLE